jgi:pimeloyl-ACP methyl ester carboxylesterase
MRNFLKYMTTTPVNETMVDVMYLMFKHVKLNTTVFKNFTDDELRGIQAPLLMLVGDKEVIYGTQQAVARCHRLNIPVEVIPNAGHAVTSDQPEIVNRRIIEFLNSA